MDINLIPLDPDLPAVPIRRGDLFVDDDGDYIRIDRIEKRKDGTLHVFYSAMHPGNTEWSSPYGNETLDEITERRKWIKIESIEKYETWAAAAKPGDFAPEEEAPNSDETAMVAAGGQQVALLKKMTEDRIARVEAVSRYMERQMRQMHSIASHYRDQLTLIHKVIGVLELYLGEGFKIVQIREGNPASVDTPVKVFQALRFMDEEACIQEGLKYQVIDFRNVDEFDQWVAVESNTRQLMAADRGICALRPSRQKHDYSKNLFENLQMEEQNQALYLLIRNGDRLYRVWTATEIQESEKLFPGEEELGNIFAKAEREGGFARRDAEDAKFGYQRFAAMLQGIFDHHTEILHPLPHMVDLFKIDTYQGVLEFIRDAEPSLGDGHVDYNTWHAQINASIGRGSRVFITHPPFYSDMRFYAEQRYNRYVNEGSEPPFPKPGVYSVDARPDKFDGLYIMHNPGDQVGDRGWVWNPHTRKNRVNFSIRRADSFILNYDAIDLEDIEYFLHSRWDREHYMRMMPVLLGIREERLKEIAWEKEFVGLVAHRLNVPEWKVWAACNWWKTKNIWKRPIREDDALALRMIERRILSQQVTERGIDGIAAN